MNALLQTNTRSPARNRPGWVSPSRPLCVAAPALLLTLAQTAQAAKLFSQIVGPLVMLAAAALVLILLGLLLKRHLSKLAQGGSDTQGFTLSDLRQLHSQGQISDQEYERARAQMVAQHRAAMHHPEPRSDVADQDDDIPEIIPEDDDGNEDEHQHDPESDR